DALPVEALAAERRDQRRVHVHDAVAVVLGDGQQLQEAGQTDEIDLRFAAGVEDAPAELVRRGARLARDDQARDARLGGPFQAEGVGAVGDDEHDLRAEPAVGDAVEQVLQRQAVAAEQHGEANGVVHTRLSRRVWWSPPVATGGLAGQNHHALAGASRRSTPFKYATAFSKPSCTLR